MIPAETKKISFHYLVKPFYFPNRTQLKYYILKLLKKEGHTPEYINYIFCDDEYLLELNRQHLQHDTYTDIISFELSPKGEPILADIYISTSRVAENAREFQTGFLNELHRVIFHGALHLCGYKDKTKKDQEKMRAMEEFHLERYFRA